MIFCCNFLVQNYNENIFSKIHFSWKKYTKIDKTKLILKQKQKLKKEDFKITFILYRVFVCFKFIFFKFLLFSCVGFWSKNSFFQLTKLDINTSGKSRRRFFSGLLYCTIIFLQKQELHSTVNLYFKKVEKISNPGMY